MLWCCLLPRFVVALSFPLRLLQPPSHLIELSAQIILLFELSVSRGTDSHAARPPGVALYDFGLSGVWHRAFYATGLSHACSLVPRAARLFDFVEFALRCSLLIPVAFVLLLFVVGTWLEGLWWCSERSCYITR